MKKVVILFACLFLCMGMATGREPELLPDLEYGTARVEISGDDALVLDPLWVKAIVFKQGAQMIALVECDLAYVQGPEVSEAREYAALLTGIPYDHICVAATHTHMFLPHKEVAPAVVEAIVQAKKNLQPVTFKSGFGQEFNVAFNRRYFMKDGSVRFNPMFLNPDIVRPAGPIDAEVGVLMIYKKKSNKAIGCLSNYALHLDIVKEYGALYSDEGAGDENAVSADYPYWIEENLRTSFGKDFNSFFLTGCCGNINHWDFSKPGPQSGHKTKSKQVGDSLSQAILRAIPELKSGTPSLAVRSRVLDLPLQSYTEEDLSWAREKKSGAGAAKSEVMSERQAFIENIRMGRILFLADQKEKGLSTWPVDVQAFRLDENTAIVSLPGEVFVELGNSIKDQSPFRHTMVVELANEWTRYIPNLRAFKQGGYEVENSRFIPEGGSMLVQAAVEMLNELKTDIR